MPTSSHMRVFSAFKRAIKDELKVFREIGQMVRRHLPFVIALSVLFIILSLRVALYPPEVGPLPSPIIYVSPTPVVCSKEVRICPDGTRVERVGEKCEFAPCPR